MARQIAYDTAKLTQDITTLFWAKGYSDTSLADLEGATGLNRRQLYNGVGDKLDMFLHALDTFIELSVQTLLGPLEGPEASVADIRNLFDEFLVRSQQPDGPAGCLICSTSQDEIAAEAQVAKRMDAFFERIKAALHNALTRAATRKEIALDAQGIEQRAAALFGAHVTLCILGRAGRPKEELTLIASEALKDLV